MTLGWKTLGLQARFMVLAGAGVLILAAATIALVSWFEFATLEDKLRAFSENELNSLNSLVENAMEQRLEDPQNVAIKVFNGWFESRNAEYPGKLWSAWSPKVITYMAATAAERVARTPLDSIDEEALRTGRPIGRFVAGTYRFSLPIVLGKSSKASCDGCHADAIGQRDGEVIAVFSSSLSTANDISALRQLLLLMAIGTLFGCLFVILGIWLLFGRVITRPLTGMTRAMQRLAEGDKTIEVPAQDRADEIGEMAKAVLVFRDAAVENARLEGEAAEHRAQAERERATQRTGAAGGDRTGAGDRRQFDRRRFGQTGGKGPDLSDVVGHTRGLSQAANGFQCSDRPARRSDAAA